MRSNQGNWVWGVLLFSACGPRATKQETDGTQIPTDPALDSDSGDSGGSGPLDTGTIDTPTFFPDSINHLNVVVRTGGGADAGTDSNDLSLCLTETDCFSLSILDVDDFRVGEADNYHFEGVVLPRSAVDRIEIRTAAGDDRWEPGCLEVLFDGERVHCEEKMEGNLFGVGFLTSWLDPLGLHVSCDTCEDVVLTEGPILGIGTPTSASVWVRTDGSRGVVLRLSDTEYSSEGVVVASATPTPETDFTAVLFAPDLVPNTIYSWAVEVEGVPHATGTLRTLPTPGTPVAFDLAFGSCSKEADQPTFSAVTAAGSELFWFVGDNHYGNTADLGGQRWNYRFAHDRFERAEMMTLIPSLAIWDDHDFLGDNTDAADPGADVALRVFKEYWVNPAYGTTEAPGVFFSTSWGDVDLFGVDDRTWRGIDGDLLGADQRAWLIDAVTSSDATFKVIASGSQWTLEGSNDSWAAFEGARDSLFEDMAGVTGVVLLSGDIHHSEFRLLPDPGIGYDVPELTSSPMAYTSPSNCPADPDSETLSCYDGGYSFIRLDIDTLATEPTIVAEIRNVDGNTVASWAFTEADLGP